MANSELQNTSDEFFIPEESGTSIRQIPLLYILIELNS